MKSGAASAIERNPSDDEFHDAPTTIGEDYPFQPLAPPPTSRSDDGLQQADDCKLSGGCRTEKELDNNQ
jgi:hypothetical protein